MGQWSQAYLPDIYWSLDGCRLPLSKAVFQPRRFLKRAQAEASLTATTQQLGPETLLIFIVSAKPNTVPGPYKVVRKYLLNK